MPQVLVFAELVVAIASLVAGFGFTAFAKGKLSEIRALRAELTKHEAELEQLKHDLQEIEPDIAKIGGAGDSLYANLSKEIPGLDGKINTLNKLIAQRESRKTWVSRIYFVAVALASVLLWVVVG